MDVTGLRRCFGQFATGVTVVTYADDDGKHGVTVNSFTSVSLEPPLVLVSLAETSKSCTRMRGRPFTVNVLAVSQFALGLHFAGRTIRDLTVPWVDDDRAPRLADTAAWIRCEAWRSYGGGDHVLFLGKVVEFKVRDTPPLLFHSGEFRRLGSRIGQTDCASVGAWKVHAERLREVEVGDIA